MCLCLSLFLSSLSLFEHTQIDCVSLSSWLSAHLRKIRSFSFERFVICYHLSNLWALLPSPLCKGLSIFCRLSVCPSLVYMRLIISWKCWSQRLSFCWLLDSGLFLFFNWFNQSVSQSMFFRFTSLKKVDICNFSDFPSFLSFCPDEYCLQCSSHPHHFFKCFKEVIRLPSSVSACVLLPHLTLFYFPILLETRQLISRCHFTCHLDVVATHLSQEPRFRT